MKPSFVERYYYITLDQLREAFGVQGDHVVEVKATDQKVIQLKTRGSE